MGKDFFQILIYTFEFQCINSEEGNYCFKKKRNFFFGTHRIDADYP